MWPLVPDLPCPDVQRVSCIASGGKSLSHQVHAAATGRRAVQEHHAAFDRATCSRVGPKGELSAIASRNVPRFRQIGEIHVLERVVNARHWRRRLAWSAKCDRESKGRHKNGNNNKDGDEKTLHAMGLTTQAQRPGARDATIATAMLPPGSLQRMVRPLVSYTQTKPLRSPHPRCEQPLT